MSDPYDPDSEKFLSRSMFWGSEFGWPDIDPEGLIFMGRAVTLTGQAMFSSSWDGKEPYTRWSSGPLNPIKGNVYSWQRWQLDEARRALRTRLSRGKSPEERALIDARFHFDGPDDFLGTAIEEATGWEDGDASAVFDDETWAMLSDLSAKIYTNDQARLDRFRKVKHSIAQAILANKIAFVAIPTYGGKWVKCDRENWRVTKWDQYFDLCNIELHGDQSEYQIFFDDAGFYKFLRSLGQPDATDTAWRPADGEPTKSWCVRPSVAREADDRAKRVFGKNPQEQQRAQVLATMWEEATGITVKASSIVTYLSTARGEKKEAKPINREEPEKASN